MTVPSPEDADRTPPPEPPEPGAAAGRIIVAGYGPVGRVVTERLERDGLAVTIIELNLDTIARQLALDKRVVYGDVSNPDVLTRAGIHEASALVLAVPDEDCAVRACGVARRMNPGIFILARTNFLSKGMLASRAGADAVVIEEVVTAEAMQQRLFEHLRRTRPEGGPGGAEPGSATGGK